MGEEEKILHDRKKRTKRDKMLHTSSGGHTNEIREIKDRLEERRDEDRN